MIDGQALHAIPICTKHIARHPVTHQNGVAGAEEIFGPAFEPISCGRWTNIASNTSDPSWRLSSGRHYGGFAQTLLFQQWQHCLTEIGQTFLIVHPRQKHAIHAGVGY
jgi:hypothetical protein